MHKATTLADKDALLAKMDRDRQALARPSLRRVPPVSSGLAGAWARTTALTAGAALGWPPFLKQPLRARAAVALRARFAELLERSQVRRVSGALTDPDMIQLATMISDVRAAALRATDEQEVEMLRAKLDAEVRRLRAVRAARNAMAPVAPRVDPPA
jgi:hypothetical protein